MFLGLTVLVCACISVAGSGESIAGGFDAIPPLEERIIASLGTASAVASGQVGVGAEAHAAIGTAYKIVAVNGVIGLALAPIAKSARARNLIAVTPIAVCDRVHLDTLSHSLGGIGVDACIARGTVGVLVARTRGRKRNTSVLVALQTCSEVPPQASTEN